MTDTKPMVVAELRCGEDGGACGRLAGTLTRVTFGGDVEFQPATDQDLEFQKSAWELYRHARCPTHRWVGLVADDYAAFESRGRRHRGKPRIYFMKRRSILDRSWPGETASDDLYGPDDYVAR